MFKKILLFLTYLIYSTSTNLICNGDFETYNLTQTSTDSGGNTQKFDYIPNNLSCWYDPTSSRIQVSRYTQKLPYPTQGVQFVSYFQRKVCQNLVLQVNSTYQLNFTMIMDPILITGTLIALLDGIQLGNITFVNPNYVVNKSIHFQSSKSNPVLCFTTQQTYNPNEPLSPFKFSPQMDNVSLILISSSIIPNSTINNNTTNTTITHNTINNTYNNTTQNTTIQPNTITITITPNKTNISNTTINNTSNNNPEINPPSIPQLIDIIYVTIIFRSQTCVYDNSILLTSSFRIEEYGLNVRVFDLTIVKLRNQVQTKVQFYLNSEGFIYIRLYPEEIYDTINPSDLSIQFPTTLESTGARYHLNIIVDGKSIILHLSDFEIKALETVNPLSKTMVKIVYQAYVILNSSGCSYFVLSLISFWNLSLMYSFLMVSSLPGFTLSFITQLLTILYSRVSIKSTIYRILKLNTNENTLDINIIDPNEKIMKFKDKFGWFNTYGLTSNAINNNFQSFFLILLSLLKYLLFKLIAKLFPQKYRVHVTKSWEVFFYNFVEDLSGFAPFFIISAFSTFLSLAEATSFGKINSILQILFFALMIKLPIISLVVKIMRLKRLGSKKNSNTRKLKKFQIAYSYTWMLFSVCLPIFLIISSKIVFFIVITPLIFYRFLLVLRNLKVMRWYLKISKLAQNLIWIVHHCIFMFYCIIDLFPSMFNFDITEQAKICGFIVIICIFGGGLLDLLCCVLAILRHGFKSVKKIFITCHKSKQVQPISNEQKQKTLKTTKAMKTNKTTSGSKKMVKIEVIFDNHEIQQQTNFAYQNHTALTKKNLKQIYKSPVQKKITNTKSHAKKGDAPRKNRRK